jgi:hypothetical protein
VLGGLANGSDLAVVTVRSDFGNLLFLSDGREEALAYRKALFREDTNLRASNLFEDLLPHADRPLHEGSAATGPREWDDPPEGPFYEVNQAEDRAAGTIPASDTGEDDPGPDGWLAGLAGEAPGLVGADPPFRIAPDEASPAPEVRFIPVENRDLAVVPTLFAGAIAPGARTGSTSPAAKDLPDPPAPPTIVVGVDPAPGESPAGGAGESGPATGRPQAVPELLFRPSPARKWDPGDQAGEGPLSDATPAVMEGVFETCAAPGCAGALLSALGSRATAGVLAPVAAAASAVVLLGLGSRTVGGDPAEELPNRPGGTPTRNVRRAAPAGACPKTFCQRRQVVSVLPSGPRLDR